MFLPVFLKNVAFMGDITTDTFSPLPAALPPLLAGTTCYRLHQKDPLRAHHEHCNKVLFASGIGTYLSVCPFILRNKLPFLQNHTPSTELVI